MKKIIKNGALLFFLLYSVFIKSEPLTISDYWSEITWSDIPTKEHILFFPGKTTFDWINSSRHKGYLNQHFNERRCNACHKDEEFGLGNYLIKASQDWLPGKVGAINVKVQIAHDDKNLHIRLQWHGQSKKPARLHTLMEYTDGHWRKIPSSPQEEVVSLTWDDGTIPLFNKQGCFLSCHFSKDPNASDTKSGFLGEYANTRDSGHSKQLPSVKGLQDHNELIKLQQNGEFADLWQWRSATSGTTGIMENQWLLDTIYSDFKASPVMLNFNPNTEEPLWMFDNSKNNFFALNKLSIVKQKNNMTLIEGYNTIPYDAKKMQPGNLLPLYVVKKNTASQEQIQRVEATWSQGNYTLVFKKPLSAANKLTDKQFGLEKPYTLSIAIHDDNVNGRAHFVSFPISVSFFKHIDADIQSTYVGTVKD